MPLLRDRRRPDRTSRRANRPSNRPRDHRGRQVRGRFGLWRPWLVALPPLGGAMIISTTMLWPSAGASSMLTLRLVLLVAAYALAVVPALLAFHSHPGRLVPRRLAAGRCGACGYPLSTLPREPDGCTVCPECGAAWKVKKGTEARRHEVTKGRR